MLCDIKKLSKDGYKHTSECEQYIFNLLSSNGLLPDILSYAKGYEPGYDAILNTKHKLKVELKLQSGVDLCIEVSKVSTGAPCGINTTNSTFYVMLNLDEFLNIGIFRILLVKNIIEYITIVNPYRVNSGTEQVIFIPPTNIKCEVIGSVKYLGDKVYDLSSFKKI